MVLSQVEDQALRSSALGVVHGCIETGLIAPDDGRRKVDVIEIRGAEVREWTLAPEAVRSAAQPAEVRVRIRADGGGARVSIRRANSELERCEHAPKPSQLIGIDEAPAVGGRRGELGLLGEPVR